MGRSLRSHRSKKNNTNLRKKVFDPVETARSERLSEKLLKLAQQPKPPRQDMEVEGEAADAKDAEHKSDKKGQGEGDADMDVDDAATAQNAKSWRLERNEKQKQNKARRVSKSNRQRKPRNVITFAKTGKARSKKR